MLYLEGFEFWPQLQFVVAAAVVRIIIIVSNRVITNNLYIQVLKLLIFNH